MKCNIKVIKDNENEQRYWCQNHRAPANNNNECLSEVKDFYNNIITITKDEIKDIKVIYLNINKRLIPDVYINNKLINGIIKINNSLIEPKDFGGLMLSKLNNIKLEDSICPYCKHSHSDDGKFAVMPHDRHLCQYCGKFFNIEYANIGNEIALYFDIPAVSLNNNTTEIEENVCITYDVFKGILLINNVNANKVIYNNEIIELKDYLNNTLKDKY